MKTETNSTQIMAIKFTIVILPEITAVTASLLVQTYYENTLVGKAQFEESSVVPKI